MAVNMAECRPEETKIWKNGTIRTSEENISQGTEIHRVFTGKWYLEKINEGRGMRLKPKTKTLKKPDLINVYAPISGIYSA